MKTPCGVRRREMLFLSHSCSPFPSGSELSAVENSLSIGWSLLQPWLRNQRHCPKKEGVQPYRAKWDASSLPPPRPPPPPLTTPNSPEAGVSVESYTVEKMRWKQSRVAAFVSGPATEKLGKAGTGGSTGGLITVHGSVSVSWGLSFWVSDILPYKGKQSDNWTLGNAVGKSGLAWGLSGSSRKGKHVGLAVSSERGRGWLWALTWRTWWNRAGLSGTGSSKTLGDQQAPCAIGWALHGVRQNNKFLSVFKLTFPVLQRERERRRRIASS